MATRFYPAILVQDRDAPVDATIGVIFPNFPGCTSAGDDASDAAVHAVDALRLHVANMEADGDEIPDPSPIDANPDWDDLADSRVVGRALIPVDILDKDRIERVNVTLPKSVLEAISRVTSNRSGFLTEAAREKLARARAAE